ncbi:MAG: putative lipid kinase [bacterium ADurb.BinA186]|nr:MAG: putative lipid kinase [bacterium ADurb.BinA186]
MKTSHRQGRVAFLLNANAKQVTAKKRMLAELIPSRDLYFSSSLSEAEAMINKIMAEGYSYIFSGGGDGTAVSTINLLSRYAKKMPEHQVPRIGVLSLGTGNALARVLGARKPEEDIKAILNGRQLKPLSVSMVETADGLLTPFAGIGYDGELMNDFESVKKLFSLSPFKKFFTSFLGFTIAGVLKTLPRQAGRQLPLVRVKSSLPAYRIMRVKGRDEEIYLGEGFDLYQGVAPLICVGTITQLGYGIKMFPFANKRPGYMHLRISAVPLATCLSHLYPSIWQGTFRHPELYDFLVKDVTIESNEGLPYQFAGDAMGYKKQLFFKISHAPVGMASLYKVPKKIGMPTEPLMMPLN